MAPFNTYHLKRRAHTVSRASRDQFWNPFRHVSWGKATPRRETWDGANLEEQRQGDENRELRLTQAMSEPPQRSRGGLQTELSTTDTVSGSRDEQTGQPKNSDGELGNLDEKPEPATSPVGTESELRQRKDDSSKTTGAEEPREKDDDDANGKKKKDSGLFRHVYPSTPFTVRNQLQRTILNSWINVLLVAVPVGIALNFVPGMNKIVIFVVNFIAIVPLAAMLSFATEEIALRTGETLGGLLNASFGNAVELIVAIIALTQNQISIVQTSLIGSILSNLLLVMGCCFFFGGLRRQEQHFNTTVAQTAASLLALAAASVIVPTVFDAQNDTSTSDVAKLSRGTAVILLLVYGCYLFFQLKTHQEVFNQASEKVPAKPWSSSAQSKSIKEGLMSNALMRHALPQETTNESLSKMLEYQGDGEEEEEGGEEPQLHFWVAVATLAISTVFIALCAEFMVDGIDAVTQQGGLSKEFVGLILLPIVGNAAEHATAVTVAIKDKMDLSLGVAIGSSMQVALFLIPLLVIIGWGMGIDAMNLSFDVFQVAVMFVAVLLTNYLIGDGKSHWLEGVLLMCLYAIIAICAFFYPNNQTNQ